MSWWRDRGVEPGDRHRVEQSAMPGRVRVFANLADGTHVPGVEGGYSFSLVRPRRATSVASKMIRRERRRQRRESKEAAGTVLRRCTFKEEARFDGLDVSHKRDWDCK